VGRSLKPGARPGGASHPHDAYPRGQNVFQGAGFRQHFDVGQPEIGLSGPMAPQMNIKKGPVRGVPNRAERRCEGRKGGESSTSGL
jgi:hypothetical protein